MHSGLINCVFRSIVFFTVMIGGTTQYVNAQVSRQHSLEVSVSDEPFGATESILTFSWKRRTPYGTTQLVYRKSKDVYDWGNIYRTLSSTDSVFYDTINTGDFFEYQVLKDTAPHGFPVMGYVLAGSRVPVVLNRGIIILVLDTTNLSPHDTSIRRYRNDLIGDGWTVSLHGVSTATTAPQIKTLVMNDYFQNPSGVKQLVLIGNVAVPYSGDYKFNAMGDFAPPDGHTFWNSAGGGHEGAWPTDVYYADMDSSLWTDTGVTNTFGDFYRCENIPGDGKFDQTYLPSLVELQVGRIDLSDLPAFTLSEAQLLRRYFYKDHVFRHKLVEIPGRALLDDNFGVIGGLEDPAGNAWRNNAPAIGADATFSLDYFPTLDSASYLFSYGCGSGSFTNCSGIGNTSNFASNTSSVRTVFTQMFGSYFGDWDTTNNFLKAALGASGNVLTSAWAGRPHWYYHHLALGETIGYSTLRTQNNFNTALFNYLYPNVQFYGFQMHTSLLGDPSVRMHPVEPAGNFTAIQDSCNNRFHLSWDQPSDTAIHDFAVFRATHIDSAFSLLATVDTTFFTDSFPLSGTNVYMLRGLKLQPSFSGSYFNASQGVFDTAIFLQPVAEIGNDTAICLNQPLLLGTADNYLPQVIYNWNPNIGDRDTVTTVVSASQLYILQILDTLSGCFDTDSLSATTLALPLAENISNSAINSCADSVIWFGTLNNGPSYLYNWTFSGGSPGDISAMGLDSPGLVSYAGAGFFATTLRVTDTASLCYNEDTAMLTTSCLSLPLKLVGLQCLNKGEQSEINWTMTEEEDILYYRVVSVSPNPGILAQIPSVQSNGTNRYSYTFSAESGIEIFAVFHNGNSALIGTCDAHISEKTAIYPNPFSEFLMLENLHSRVATTYSIVDCHGKIVRKGEFQERMKLSGMSELPDGLYILMLNVPNGYMRTYKLQKLTSF